MSESQTHDTRAGGCATLEKPLTVEFLYLEDCPSHERALQLLRDVLQEEEVEARIEIKQVETDEEAELYRFPGSPTIRVNGTDIDDQPDLPVGLTCRAYRLENGRISPLPPRERVVRAIRRASQAA